MKHTINIISDKSPVCEHNANLLARGIQARDPMCEVHIRDVAESLERAIQTSNSDYAEENAKAMSGAEALFGALSVFEKHVSKDPHCVEKGKRFGVLMTSKTTFDGPTPTKAHSIDQRLVERLAQIGYSHLPVCVERTEEDEEIQMAGGRFVDDVFPRTRSEAYT
ncbi:hypothetical protein BCR43DRAFT_518548 [Syncephalastrum racemosum]|uniref:Uncharacterized protein n=1 Tax=Syncephalastrum racemosum TaxID=13706 RepID=A0A1X2H182_SYNRA|nr:hypothetical protein BCR43DRAFT_518548 [Syncephalastrum racemosum]